EQLAKQGQARSAQTVALLERSRALQSAGDLAGAIAELRTARQPGDGNLILANALVDALLAQARVALESDPESAGALIVAALEINPGSTSAKTLRALLEDRKRERVVGQLLSQARQLQASTGLEQAIAVLDEGLALYPREARLVQLRNSLERSRLEQEGAATR